MKAISSSFRDPSGFVFKENNSIYRTINNSYKKDYLNLIESGLYKNLVEKKLLIKHEELNKKVDNSCIFKIIKPIKIPFISYPYEWSFSQLKDAALLTLQIQKLALDHDMVLKDSNAYNVQFLNGKPIFIDTLSFEIYKEGSPWQAYKQFCQHFLAPLALMKYKEISLNKLFRIFIDGIPLNLASKILPFKTKFNFSLLAHIHLHSKYQKKYEAQNTKKKQTNSLSKKSMYALIDNLKSTISKLKYQTGSTEWANYYNGDSYTQKGFQNKKASLPCAL